MKLDVANLRVIISGAAQGIGWATAKAFLENGAAVHICDSDPDRIAAAQQREPAIGATVADVSRPRDVDAFIDTAIAQMGGVDVLVNNAGISGPAGPVETLDPDAWQHTLAVNINGQFHCARRVIPHLKQQRSGCIINIATTAALYGYPNRAPYAASKWAVVGFTKTLAMELGAFNVRANVICPGSVNNPRIEHVINIESEATGRSAEEIRQGLYNQVSMQTFIDPEEIASTILFLSSPLAAKISGQVLSVDGNTETMRI